MKRLLLFLAFSSCDSCLPEGFRSTEKAAMSRMIGADHRKCVENNECWFVSQCHRESEARCVAQGYEKSCGDLDIEGSCGTGIKR